PMSVIPAAARRSFFPNTFPPPAGCSTMAPVPRCGRRPSYTESLHLTTNDDRLGEWSSCAQGIVCPRLLYCKIQYPMHLLTTEACEWIGQSGWSALEWGPRSVE